ncbi:MAG: GvpL/GvpF family gas vesicle protein [Bacteroidota bacterium]
MESSRAPKLLEMESSIAAPAVFFQPVVPIYREKVGKLSTSAGRFVYAVILPNGKVSLDLLGLDGCKVYMILYRDVAAVVSDYPVGTVSLIRKNLSPYHDVTRRFAEICTTIPARFGQIAEDGEEVLGLLRRHYPRIRKELERLDQKVEMGVKVFWETDDFFGALVHSDTELRELRNRAFSKQSPPTTLELIQLGEFVSHRIKTRKEAISQKVVSVLRTASAEEKLDESGEDKIIMSGWFLVSKARQGDFVELVNKAASLIGEEYAVKVGGPWAPFNFVEHIELEM